MLTDRLVLMSRALHKMLADPRSVWKTEDEDNRMENAIRLAALKYPVFQGSALRNDRRPFIYFKRNSGLQPSFPSEIALSAIPIYTIGVVVHDTSNVQAMLEGEQAMYLIDSLLLNWQGTVDNVLITSTVKESEPNQLDFQSPWGGDSLSTAFEQTWSFVHMRFSRSGIVARTLRRTSRFI